MLMVSIGWSFGYADGFRLMVLWLCLGMIPEVIRRICLLGTVPLDGPLIKMAWSGLRYRLGDSLRIAFGAPVVMIQKLVKNLKSHIDISIVVFPPVPVVGRT